MDHSFQKSFTDITKCNRCSFPEDKHGSNAVCDACPNVGELNVCNGMALCRECIAKEIETSLPSVPASEITPSNNDYINPVVQMSKDIDNSIRVSTDLFNAATPAIVELKAAIDNDANIPPDKKRYELAKVLLDRFNLHKKAIFEMQANIVEEHTNQKAIQLYLNGLATKFQAEEREKLKIADINYKPEVVKELKPKVSKPKSTKITSAEIKAACAQFGVDEFMVRMTITAQNCSLLEAISRIVAAKTAAMNTPKTEAKQS